MLAGGPPGWEGWTDLSGRCEVPVGRCEAPNVILGHISSEALFVIRVFAIVLAGHAQMFSTWQPGAVLAMIVLCIRVFWIIGLLCELVSS